MTLIITHTGQTGVERGADRAARTVGFDIGGHCSYGHRDELGVLPPEIAASLSACQQRGARSALRATLAEANALVIAVPDATKANDNTGIESLRRAARLSNTPYWVVDPITDLVDVAGRVRQMELGPDPVRVMITGPRLTRWHDGERMGWRVVARLSLTPVVVPVARKILVVDDHPDVAESTCFLLRALGHECVVANSGAAGLEAAAKLVPDIALLDIGLPDLSGYEVARRLRAATSKPLFLAAITGRQDARDASDAFAAGFDRHVVKPASAEVIVGLLEQAELRLVG